MRDIKRIKRILDLIEKVWSCSSNMDMRFTQFLINFGIAKDEYGYWIIEDDELEKGLIKHIKKYKIK
jgi:hypothetical protein